MICLIKRKIPIFQWCGCAVCVCVCGCVGWCFESFSWCYFCSRPLRLVNCCCACGWWWWWRRRWCCCCCCCCCCVMRFTLRWPAPPEILQKPLQPSFPVGRGRKKKQEKKTKDDRHDVVDVVDVVDVCTCTGSASG